MIFYFINKLKKKFWASISYVLRTVEVLLCLRKKQYKTHTFKKNHFYEHYHTKLKWRQPFA